MALGLAFGLTLTASAATAAMSAPVAAPASAPAAPKMENLCKVRYCEVLTITRHLLTFTVKI